MNTVLVWLLAITSTSSGHGGSVTTFAPYPLPTLAACEHLRANLPSAWGRSARCIETPILVPAQQQSLPPQQQQARPAKKAVRT